MTSHVSLHRHIFSSICCTPLTDMMNRCMQANFFEYMEVVADALVYFSGQECFDQFTTAAESVAALSKQGVG